MREVLIHSPKDEADLRILYDDDGIKDTLRAKDAWLSYLLEEELSYGLGKIEVPVLLTLGGRIRWNTFSDTCELRSQRQDRSVSAAAAKNPWASHSGRGG